MGRAVLLGLIAAACLLAIDVNNLPQPTGYVNDIANVVNGQSKAELEAFCTRVEQELGVQFALVTIETLDDRPIRDVALAISRKWGVGSKKDNQGVLLLLAIKDHKSDIETGRGIEPYITDGFAGGTLRSMRPDLRSGDYGAALLTAARGMAGQIAQGKGIAFSGALQIPEEEPPQRRGRSRGGISGSLIVLGIFLLLWLFGRGGGRRGGGGRRRGGGFGGGFLTGMLLNSLLGGGRGRGGFGGGDWGGGGFGGDSGGGGGFGGFGGGGFGGGGASSDW